VGALAAVVRQAPEQGRRVDVLRVGLESHRVATEVGVPTLDLRQVDRDRRGHLVRAGHCFLLEVECFSSRRRDLRGHDVTWWAPDAAVEFHAMCEGLAAMEARGRLDQMSHGADPTVVRRRGLTGAT
jgi:hypothetical protein